MFRSLLPKETGFFDYFEQVSALAVECCRELRQMVSYEGDITAHVDRIKEIEKEADRITHTCTDALHNTFITPIDRAQIHGLSKRLDDVIDAIDATTSRMAIYEMTDVRPEALQLAEVLAEASGEIEQAVKHLRNLRRPEDLNQHLIRIYSLENQGDAILRGALSRLFKEEPNPIQVIKWKEIFERLERATDRCEAVASIIQSILIEAS
ncbi:MAG TPA: DUF47 family protein [Candidatus Sumerlaeota bacterium]|nr:DUF47 family protein [Candidatus Sumerlaeota bacterium]HPK02030.1 DUF47 family protein [Candidatus Sumerlaeota bacterium]